MNEPIDFPYDFDAYEEYEESCEGCGYDDVLDYELSE